MRSFLRIALITQLLAILVISLGGTCKFESFGTSVSTSDVSQTLYSSSIPSNRVFLNQTFEAESVGVVAANWTMLYPQYGNISVVNSTWYGSSSRGKSGMISDDSTDNNPVCYRFFSQQSNTVVISFAIKPTSSIGVRKTVEIYVDDSEFNGANIIFKNGQIGCQTRYYGFNVLRSSYIPDRWYKIRMVVDIPQNSYSIYIDDHLEQVNAALTGPCTQIHRIIFNETSGQDPNSLPVAFIDEILGVQGIEIPRDYATIQAGIDAASSGDLIFVAKQRVYFETVTIPAGKDGIWLYGEDANTTIIDASFTQNAEYGQNILNGISVHANNVKISRFTVRSTPYGPGIMVDGSYNTIENCIVINGLGIGIDISSPNNTVTSSTIKMNLKCGVRVTGLNTTLMGNFIESNDEQGILISSWNSYVEGNIIRSNLGCGIQISQGEQNLIRNNTAKKNGIGIECDAGAGNNLIYQNRFINNTLQASNVDATNVWDDDYPYVPDKEVGGGNFWSDFDSADVYSGTNQDELVYVGLSAPDGVCDRPYVLSPTGIDNYPLFLIQNVTQDPSDPTKINYTTLVNVTVTTLKSVDIGDAHLEVQYDSTRQNRSMTISGNKLRGTIPALKYGTKVTYNVTVHADAAEISVRSTNYPPLGPYSIGDRVGPTIGAPVVTPAKPVINQTIFLVVSVTEPQNASGVSRVYVTCWFPSSPWGADMNATGNNSYSVTIPPQAWGGTMSISISAVDYAGNLNSKPAFNMTVDKLPELTVSYKNVTYANYCEIDLGVLSRGQKLADNNLKLNNTGMGVLFWKIDRTSNVTWVKITPPNGTTPAGKGNTTTISVDTTGLTAGSYTADFVITTNGSIPFYMIRTYITVNDIVIDNSYSSLDIGIRSDVNMIQFYGFHAVWGINGTDAISGKINVTGIGWVDVNATGWANFNDISSDPVERTYFVQDVNFTYITSTQTYSIRSFTQKVANVTTIWDRVRITLTVLDEKIDVDSQVDILWNRSTYEFDNSTFYGTVYFNDTLTKSNAGTYNFTASSITDSRHGLTQFESNTVACTWNTIETANVGMPLWAIVSIALTFAFGFGATLIIVIRTTANRTSREDFKTRKKTHG